MSAPTDRGGRAHDPEVIADVREQLERGSLRITGENPANSENDPASAPTERLLVVVGDCPTADVEAVVAGGPVSTELVWYVRRWMQAEHEATREVFDAEAPKLDRVAIAREVYDACELEALGEPDGEHAWAIAEAAGWEVLADPCPF